jgi:septal ring factor EnvC (AmiA/AmiB activator)
MKSVRVGLSLLCFVLASCDRRPTPQPTVSANALQAQAIQKQLEHYEAQLKTTDEQLARVEAQGERYEAILAKWEQQAARIDRILDRWEKLLDRLEAPGLGGKEPQAGPAPRKSNDPE